MPRFSIKKLFTLDNLRMKNGEWFIDKTLFSDSEKKKTEICIGKRVSWQKLSELVPEAIFKETITGGSIKKLEGITFAKLNVEIADEKGYTIPLCDENGYRLFSIDTGNSLADDLERALKSRKNEGV